MALKPTTSIMDNTAGSLTLIQKSIIIGTLLGDGYLRIVPGRNDAFLEVNHTFKQKEYVDWKFNMLKNMVISPPKLREYSKRKAYRFFTRQSSELTQLYNLFYKDKSKVIPDLTLEPLSLAVWYMDDGSKVRDSDVYLNTQQFSYADQLKLVSMLSDLAIESRLNKDKHYFRIRILKKSLPQFRKLIGPYIIPSMRYKL